MDAVPDWIYHAAAGGITGLFSAGVVYWRLVVLERISDQHQRGLDDMPAREAAIRREITQSSDELWNGLKQLETESKMDRKETGQFREQTARQLGGMLTRDQLDAALAQQEQRLATIIKAALNGNGRHHDQ